MFKPISSIYRCINDITQDFYQSRIIEMIDNPSLEKGASPNGKINDGSELSVMHFAVRSTIDIFLFLISQNGSIFNCDAEKTSVYEQRF